MGFITGLTMKHFVILVVTYAISIGLLSPVGGFWRDVPKELLVLVGKVVEVASQIKVTLPKKFNEVLICQFTSHFTEKSCISISKPSRLMPFTQIIGTLNSVVDIVARLWAGRSGVRIPADAN